MGFVLLLFGVIGPMVTGIGFVFLTRDKEERRDYWRRVISFRQIPDTWLLMIYLFVPALNILVVLVVSFGQWLA